MSKLPDEVVEACRRQVDHAINEADPWADVDDDDCLTAVKVTLATMKRHGWVPERDWETIDKAPENETVLTQHVDDLHPVAAFHFKGSDGEPDYWGRAIEGPEDGMFDEGNAAPLYREPTHFKPMPDPPGESK